MDPMHTMSSSFYVAIQRNFNRVRTQDASWNYPGTFADGSLIKKAEFKRT